MTFSKSVKYWSPAVIYACVIFYVSALSQVSTSLSGWNFDKLLHLIEYIPFGILIVFGMTFGSSVNSKKKSAIFSLVLLILYALSDEIHQSFVPGRDANAFDLMADIAGGSIGIFMFFVFRNNLKHQKR
jgi:VanZ family protein